MKIDINKNIDVVNKNNKLLEVLRNISDNEEDYKKLLKLLAYIISDKKSFYKGLFILGNDLSGKKTFINIINKLVNKKNISNIKYNINKLSIDKKLIIFNQFERYDTNTYHSILVGLYYDGTRFNFGGRFEGKLIIASKTRVPFPFILGKKFILVNFNKEVKEDLLKNIPDSEYNDLTIHLMPFVKDINNDKDILSEMKRLWDLNEECGE